MDIRILEEATEPGFTGEMAEVLEFKDGKLQWTNHPFNVMPDTYTQIKLPKGELYLLTSSWLDQKGDRVKFWYNPGVSQDILVDPPFVETGTEPAANATAPDTLAAPLKAGGYATVVGTYAANVRSGPGMNYPVQGAARAGNVLEVNAASGQGTNSWFDIYDPTTGTRGWVSVLYLRGVDPLAGQ